MMRCRLGHARNQSDPKWLDMDSGTEAAHLVALQLSKLLKKRFAPAPAWGDTGGTAFSSRRSLSSPAPSYRAATGANRRKPRAAREDGGGGAAFSSSSPGGRGRS